ncbi:MAG: hypothetical protein M1835_007272, partial [Candelina submexicana]
MGNWTHLDRRTNENKISKPQEPEDSSFLWFSDPSSSLDKDDFMVSLTVTNPNTETTVYLLTWNSILEPDSYNYSPAELGISLTSPFERAAEFSPAERPTHKRYGSASIKNSFIKIGPSEEFRTQRWDSGSVWSWVRSRQPYHAGKYTLRLDTQVHGFQMSASEAPEHLEDGGNLFLKRSALSDLPIVALTREIEFLSRRDPKACDSVRAVAVGVARVRAKALAEYTRLYPDEILWQEYNYGPRAQQHAVAEVYNNIENYGIGQKNSLLTELCGYTLRPWDNPDLVAYMDGASKLVFCDKFFTIPAFLECDCQSINDMNMVDRSGVYLHELSHVDAVNKNIGGIGVHDGKPHSKGKPGQCYGWKCVTNAARNRPPPRADNSMPPNDWQQTSKDGLPENIADFYELHAYAVRAKQCSRRREAQQQYCQNDKDCGVRGK